MDNKQILLSVKETFSSRILNDAIQLKDKFMVTKGNTLSNESKVCRLMDILLEATGYEQTITEMKIGLLRIRNVANRKFKIESYDVQSARSFNSMSKKDQDNRIKLDCFDAINILDSIDSKIEQVNVALEYIKSASFNIKSIIATLREYVSLSTKN